MPLHSFKMGFVPLICRCYMFLYIRLPFNRSFWEVPKYILFASQKKRDLGLLGWQASFFLLSSKDYIWGKCEIITCLQCGLCEKYYLKYGFLESALKINKILRCFIYSNLLNMYCLNFNINLTKKFLLFECFYWP